VGNQLTEKGSFKEEELKFCEGKSIPKYLTKKLEPKVYPNAMKRAEKTKEFLDMLECEVEICLNFDKQQTVEKFGEIQKLAD
jgi:hypothetical protein